MTFAEAEAQARRTPALLGWSVLRALLAEPLREPQGEVVSQTAWYASRYRPSRTLRRLDDARWPKVWYVRSQTDFERLLNVGQQVIRIFYAGGIAHQAITNPQPLAFLRRKFVVRHQRRLFH